MTSVLNEADVRVAVREMRVAAALTQTELSVRAGLPSRRCREFEMMAGSPVLACGQRTLLALLTALCSVDVIDYGPRMRAARLAAGLTKQAAADQAGITAERWREAERGSKSGHLRPETRAKVARWLERHTH